MGDEMRQISEEVEYHAFKNVFSRSHNLNFNVGPLFESMLNEHSENLLDMGIAKGIKRAEWTYEEVDIFCDGMKKYGDNLRLIWLLLSDTRSLEEVIDFYYRLYPHGMEGGFSSLYGIYQ